MITAIAIDDEPVALDIIRRHASRLDLLDLKATFLQPPEALAYLAQQPVDLVFLDIHMPGTHGLQLAQQLPAGTRIIFTTAYADYAVQGFEIAATDYLLKPIGFDRFQLACQRAQEQLLASASAPEPPSLFVKDGYEWVKLLLTDITLVEAQNNYVIFWRHEQKTTARMTLTEALEQLPATRFMRIHKSYVIALSKVERVEAGQLWIAGRPIPVSHTYRKGLLSRLAELK